MFLSHQKTILVTGGAGFIGSALIQALNQRGKENILVCDRLGRDEKWRNLVPLKFSDYLDADDLLQKLNENPNHLGKIETVFHLGACSSTTESDAQYLMENNFRYTKTLALWALQQKARFVYASSAATYGDGSLGMEDTEKDLSKYRPLNMYGYSKHCFDVYAKKSGILGNLVGLKYFNVFGPNEYHKGEMRSVVNKAYHQIQETGSVNLFKSYRADYKDGEQKRDFLYIKDAVDITLHLAANPLAQGIYNVGSGKASTWIELVHAIFAALNLQPSIVFVDMPETMRSTYQYHTRAHIDKLRKSQYTKEITPLTKAVEEYVTMYLRQGAYLGDVEN